MSAWENTWDKTPYTLPPWAKTQLVEAVERFNKSFAPEDTWIHQVFGVHSFLYRVDCIIDDRLETVHVCEVEERPCGLGELYRHTQSVGVEKFRKKWPAVQVVRSATRQTDDELWGLEVVDFEHAQEYGRQILIRARPEELPFHTLRHCSVSTISNEGLKCYGLRMGLWRKMSKQEAFEMAKSTGVVIKPAQGTRTRGVHIVVPEHLRQQLDLSYGGEIRSPETVKKQVTEGSNCYVQQLHIPMRFSWRSENEFGVCRIYFGFDPRTREFGLLEDGIVGMWNTRPNTFTIHGAPDACFGPIIFK